MERQNLRSLLSEAANRAISYAENVDERSVFPPQRAIEELGGLGGPLPERGEDAIDVLKLLDEIGSPATVATTGGRYFGFVVGGALPTTIGAHWIADAWDQNAGLYDLSPVSTYLEEVALQWIVDLLHLPSNSGGAFVTGAQMANFTALAAARHAVLHQAGWNVEGGGLYGAPPITVVVGEEAHATVLKAIALLGLGRDRVITVPADGQGRIKPAEIPRLTGPSIVCAQAGNVNSGAFDPLIDICHAAHQQSAWVHVDGAFGIWAAVAPKRRYLVDGLPLADSWATDAHKWLNVPYDSGIALVREPNFLRDAMTISASYLSAGQRREPMQWGPESSRRARAIEIWAALRSLGREGLAELIERTCRHATTFAERLRSAGFDVLNEVVLNQTLVSFGDAATTTRIIRAIQEEGTCWCGGTTWRGRAAMRISVSSWATTDADVERSLGAILAIASKETARRS
jgi:glutamate/tyrosine decarboxylase-like PLP-dependent enzyme